ncbi:MAG: hypothetical protein B6I35_15350 [Anaerolineaceae bacterium 4572_32.2]|nr:MAG: hypothetical protein B6I35_15350 [Anaerolineaceae bacterium 4572_32.2]
MRYKLTIPARINVLGNPADACEGDFATISAAVDVRAGAVVEPATGLVLEALRRTGSDFSSVLRLEFQPDEIPLPYDGDLDLLKGAVNRLHGYSAEFRVKFAQRGVRVATWTDVPRQSGLGGSSLFVLLTLAGLREFYDLDRLTHNDYVLAELTQRVEAQELGITCGFADRYVPLFGGIAYLDYRGKLHHQKIGQEPYVTYERLDAYVDDVPLVTISTGIVRDSGDVHGQMRPRYLQEHDAWINTGGETPSMVRFMSGAWDTAWRGKIARRRFCLCPDAPRSRRQTHGNMARDRCRSRSRLGAHLPPAHRPARTRHRSGLNLIKTIDTTTKTQRSQRKAFS